VRQIARRAATQHPELPRRWRYPQDSSGLAHLGVEDLFNLGRRSLSRFSNHGNQLPAYIIPEEKPTMAELLIHKSIEVGASIEILWKILTDSKFIQQYMFGCYVESDWKPGSPMLWKGAADGKLYVHGHIVSIKPPHRLEYTVFDSTSTLADIPSNYLTMTYDLKTRGDHAAILEVPQGDFAKVEDGQRRYNDSLGDDNSVLEGIKKLAEAQSQLKQTHA
jgi:uncharacterized protein YndB with AHSA1/START domain